MLNTFPYTIGEIYTAYVLIFLRLIELILTLFRNKYEDSYYKARG